MHWPKSSAISFPMTMPAGKPWMASFFWQPLESTDTGQTVATQTPIPGILHP
jgi:hypothetical protein